MNRDLDIRHCRALVAVHDCGGVGAAARVLGVAQSTVSEALLSLERSLSARVMVRRVGRETSLSATATALLPFARSIIATSEAGLAVVARGDNAPICLGVVESVSSFLLPGSLSAFRSDWPQVDVRVSIGLCADLLTRLARRELDAVVTIEANQPAGGLQVEAWPMHLELVVPANHPLGSWTVSLEELAAQRLLLSDAEGSFNDLVRAWFGAMEPPRIESAGSVDGVKRGLMNGHSVGVLPRYAVAKEFSAGSLRGLVTEPPLPLVSLRLSTAAHGPSSAAMTALLAGLRNVFTAHVARAARRSRRAIA